MGACSQAPSVRPPISVANPSSGMPLAAYQGAVTNHPMGR